MDLSSTFSFNLVLIFLAFDIRVFPNGACGQSGLLSIVIPMSQVWSARHCNAARFWLVLILFFVFFSLVMVLVFLFLRVIGLSIVLCDLWGPILES